MNTKISREQTNMSRYTDQSDATKTNLEFAEVHSPPSIFLRDKNIFIIVIILRHLPLVRSCEGQWYINRPT